MKIGYPCINWTIGCKGNRTFRLKSYSEERLIETVQNNLNCLSKMLQFNLRHEILFFRVTSDLIPFASHPICKFKWQEHFREELKTIGDLIQDNNIRISMHPDQFILINSLDFEVFEKSVKELEYHTQVLDLMGLDASAKVQIHVGGVYGDKARSMERFVSRYQKLEKIIGRRLVIENDDRLYNLKDCIQLSAETGVPVLFDVLHHKLNNTGEKIEKAFELFAPTWKEEDGLPMVDYSTQQKDKLKSKHAHSIDLKHFKNFLTKTKRFDFDIMLEIKDKEASALKAVNVALKDDRFHTS